MIPTDYRFQESHEWCAIEGDVATIGISHFAVEHLSDLAYLDLPEPGTSLEQGERFGEIESVKAVSELFSPVSGEVLEINEDLPESLDTLQKDPFQEGWMIKIKMTSPDEAGELMDAGAYEKLIASEA